MPKDRPIGLLCAVPFECEAVAGAMRGRRATSRGVLTGTIGRRRAALLAPGPGAANAAWGATVLIERHGAGPLIVFGIGGAYPGSGLRIGDLAMAERETYADLGVLTSGGFMGIGETGMELLRAGGLRYLNDFPLDASLIKKALKSLGAVKKGPFLTVSGATGTLRRALELESAHCAICENMEGAAAAQTCARYGAAMLELRGISNIVEDRDTSRWDKALAASRCQEAVLRLVGSL